MIPGLRKLYDWVLHWAKTPAAPKALFLIAFVESSVFPVPPDVLLIAMVISVREKWLRYAFICLAGSVLGGLFGYFIGWGVWEVAHPFFFKYVFSEAAFEKVRGLYARYDFWVVFTAAFTPIPYKVFTIAAGVCRINLAAFLLASILGRAGRFFLVGGLLRIFGERIRTFIDKYFNGLTVVFMILLVGGFLLVKYLL